MASLPYQIIASNSPDSYGAIGLPSGLSLDSDTGIISGTMTELGTFTVTITATNAAGLGQGKLVIVAAVAGAHVIENFDGQPIENFSGQPIQNLS